MVRWLHLSDVHERDGEPHFRRRMYGQIIDEVRRRPKPDFVFLTGDMAFAGTDGEYHSLEEHFIASLKEAVGKDASQFLATMMLIANAVSNRDRGLTT